MTKTMAEAIREELRKGSYQMPGDTLPYETQAAAVAAALTAAGYGLVADAKREAWDHGHHDGAVDAMLRMENDGAKTTPNPYRKASNDDQ